MSKLSSSAGLAGALVVAALVGGTLISAVAASTAAPRTADHADPVAAAAAPSAAAAATLASTAPRSGRRSPRTSASSEADMVAAARKAAVATIDEAVDRRRPDDGRGRPAQGADRRGPGRRLCAARRLAARRSRRRPLGVAQDGLTAAADALELTPAEVRAQLRAGKSLKDIATAQNVPYATVSAAIVAAVKADLDAAVAAGTISRPGPTGSSTASSAAWPTADSARIVPRRRRPAADGQTRFSAICPPGTVRRRSHRSSGWTCTGHASDARLTRSSAVYLHHDA